MTMSSTSAEQIPTITDILAAKQRISDSIRTTPVLTDPLVNDILGCELWLKCENLQRTGAFKFRGASNAVARLDEMDQHGDVATHSSGIIDSMSLIWRHFRMLIEPSSATVIAAIREHPDVFTGQRVAAIKSGGNVNLE